MGTTMLPKILGLLVAVLSSADALTLRAGERTNASFTRHKDLNPSCPVMACRNKKWRPEKEQEARKMGNAVGWIGTPSLLQLESEEMERLGAEEPNEPQPYSVASERGKQHDVDKDTGVSIYNVDFKPGHFTCLSCDAGSCPGCDVICDLSQCMGEFYTTECWCQKETSVRLRKPLWWFRKYDARYMPADNVYQMRCDTNCKGALCDTDKLQCKPREEACKPWWWCKGVDPPKKDNLVPKDGWPAGFSYTSSLTLLQQNRERKTVERRQDRIQEPQKRLESFWAQLEKEKEAAKVAKKKILLQETDNDKALRAVADSQKASRDFEPNDIGKMKFAPGRWVCDAGALPPQVQDPTSYIWQERGYVVFDKYQCKGGAFDHKCFCWNEPKYLAGLDPMTSGYSCDSTCKWGACEGRTCGPHPPPPLPPPPPPPVIDPVESEKMKEGELHTLQSHMDPI